MFGQCRFHSANQIKAFRSKETWRNWVKKTIYVSFSLVLNKIRLIFPIFTAKTWAIMQDLCVTATWDHKVYASFRPSIVAKGAETCGKMNFEKYRISWVLSGILIVFKLLLQQYIKMVYRHHKNNIQEYKKSHNKIYAIIRR